MRTLVLVLSMFLPTFGMAAPVAQVVENNLKITLFDVPCQLTEVSNLQMRATWSENGKVFEGCWGGSPVGVVMLYFSDKSVAAVPVRAFTKVQGV